MCGRCRKEGGLTLFDFAMIKRKRKIVQPAAAAQQPTGTSSKLAASAEPSHSLLAAAQPAPGDKLESSAPMIHAATPEMDNDSPIAVTVGHSISLIDAEPETSSAAIGSGGDCDEIAADLTTPPRKFEALSSASRASTGEPEAVTVDAVSGTSYTPPGITSNQGTGMHLSSNWISANPNEPPVSLRPANHIKNGAKVIQRSDEVAADDQDHAQFDPVSSKQPIISQIAAAYSKRQYATCTISSDDGSETELQYIRICTSGVPLCSEVTPKLQQRRQESVYNSAMPALKFTQSGIARTGTPNFSTDSLGISGSDSVRVLFLPLSAPTLAIACDGVVLSCPMPSTSNTTAVTAFDESESANNMDRLSSYALFDLDMLCRAAELVQLELWVLFMPATPGIIPSEHKGKENSDRSGKQASQDT